MASPETWKFLVMALITVNLKQIFRHVDATLPKYLIREYGCDAPVGGIYGINPGRYPLVISPCASVPLNALLQTCCPPPLRDAQLPCTVRIPVCSSFRGVMRIPRHAGMIIFLVPIVGALTTRCSHFDMIHLGSYLSALSPLWIVAFPDHGLPHEPECCC